MLFHRPLTLAVYISISSSCGSQRHEISYLRRHLDCFSRHIRSNTPDHLVTRTLIIVLSVRVHNIQVRQLDQRPPTLYENNADASLQRIASLAGIKADIVVASIEIHGGLGEVLLPSTHI